MRVRGQSLAEMVLELFSYLDATEESDSGRPFKPTQISCCRVMVCHRLAELLPQMKDEATALLGGPKE